MKADDETAQSAAICPCCTDRATLGLHFFRPTVPPEGLCGECAAAPEVDGEALLKEVLGASPVRLR